MEEYCEENNVDLLHIRQISKSKAFNCVFKFVEEKVKLFDFWPKYVTMSIFYPKEARDCLKKVHQILLIASPPLKPRTTKQ